MREGSSMTIVSLLLASNTAITMFPLLIAYVFPSIRINGLSPFKSLYLLPFPNSSLSPFRFGCLVFPMLFSYSTSSEYIFLKETECISSSPVVIVNACPSDCFSRYWTLWTMLIVVFSPSLLMRWEEEEWIKRVDLFFSRFSCLLVSSHSADHTKYRVKRVERVNRKTVLSDCHSITEERGRGDTSLFLFHHRTWCDATLSLPFLSSQWIH